MNISERIRNLREDNDLTQQDIADKLKISRATVNRFENNIFEIKLCYAIELAKIFNVSLDYIAGLKDEQK